MFKNVFLIMSQSMSLLGPKLIFLLTPQSVFSPNNTYIFVIIFHRLVKVVMTQLKSFEKLHLRHQGHEKQLAPHILCEFNDQNNFSFCKMKASLREKRQSSQIALSFIFYLLVKRGEMPPSLSSVQWKIQK